MAPEDNIAIPSHRKAFASRSGETTVINAVKVATDSAAKPHRAGASGPTTADPAQP